MDICKLLKNVNGVNQYISITKDSIETCRNSRIPLNMTTILSLNKIRALEVEYFNKCEDNGIACAILERMLSLPPSKTWGVLGKELVFLLQYWLQALLRHLSNKFRYWWKFLKLILKYLREIREKDPSLPNMLVEHTAECLLELATRDQFDAMQQQEVLYCLNMFCSESSREIRFALRNKFGSHFVKLALRMAECGYLPCQYSVLETLLRWLLPRQQPSLRQAEAEKWFPKGFYSLEVADIFVERPWKNFFRDARDLLNTHNEAGELIASVLCRSLTVGKLVILSEDQSQEAWLDINVPTKCMTVLLDPRLLESVGVANHRTFETLLISEDNTKTAKLYRHQKELTISVSTHHSPQILPASIQLVEGSGDVTIAVTSRCRLSRLDNALRRVFGDKYQVLLNVDEDIQDESSSKETEYLSSSQKHEDPRFSHPTELKSRTRSGYIVRQGPRSGCKSPSTASTSSLAQLREKLSALPRHRYDKTLDGVCALPDLSVVTEHTENTNSSFISILRRPHGVITRNKIPFKPIESPLRKSQSDNESYQRNRARQLSPIHSDNEPSSSLLAAALQNDESIINGTVDELAKINLPPDDGIVDLIAKEFMQSEAQKKGDILDSGIGIDEKKNGNCSDNTDAIENTPFADDPKSMKQQYKIKKVSSTDESNTDQNEAPSYVNTRSKSRVKDNTTDSKAKPKIDEKVVESFFSQHFAENKVAEVCISPTLAKKINETSSEGSDELDQNYLLINDDHNEDIGMQTFDEVDVIECLNSMVDQICDEFDKCSQYLNREQNIEVFNENTEHSEPALDKTATQTTIKPNKRKDQKKKTVANKIDAKTKNIKLTYKISPKANTRSMKQKKNKLQLEFPSKMSTIIEGNSTDDAIENEHIIMNDTDTNHSAKKIELNVENLDKQTSDTKKKKNKALKETQDQTATGNPKPTNINEVNKTPKNYDTVTPNMKRKRKLYSPKDEQVDKKCTLRVPETEEDDDNLALSEFKRKKELKTKATCYKEIEKDRKRYVRAPRTRRSKNKSELASPRTRKFNDMFDKLKETVEGEKVKIADKTFEPDAYNFTSDSEDEDFKKKTIDFRKNNSMAPSAESTVSKRGRVIKRTKDSKTNSSDDNRTTKRKATKRKNDTSKILLDSVRDIVDERMREAKDVLNTSIVVDKATIDVTEPELALGTAPAMEIIEAETRYETRKAPENKKNTKKVPKSTDIKKSHKKTPTVKTVLDDDRTESPLPGLVVETAPSNRYDPDISASMVDKFKKIYRDGPESCVNESNTTHNLLSDMERNNFSSQNIDMIAEDVMELEEAMESRFLENKKFYDKKRTSSNKSLSQEKNKLSRKNNTEGQFKSKGSDDNENKLFQKSHRDVERISQKKYVLYNEDTENDENSQSISLKNKSTQVNNRKITRNTSKTTHYVSTLTGNNDKSESNIEIINVIESSKEEGDPNSGENTDHSTNIVNSSDVRTREDTIRKSKFTADNIEVINITDAQDDNPESVGSAGITGHGESEEHPPTPTLIDEDIQPRNVGLEDLDLSVKEYFDKLTKEINGSAQSKTSHSKRNESTSPVVSVTRISLEDISKWLPSRRGSSETDVSTVKLNEDGHSNKNFKAISVEEIVPVEKKSLKLNHNRKREVKSKVSIDSDDSPKNIVKKNIAKTSEASGRPQRRSVISPIKLFDDLISECDKKSEKTLSDDENYMKDIKDMYCKKKVLKSLRNRNVSELRTKSASVSSEDSRISSSTKIDTRQCKRTSDKEKEVKRQKVEVKNIETCESIKTLSSVSDWLKKNEPAESSREAITLSIKDTVQNVLEKLDTTLVEIHQNTSRKFVHLFVESQRHLSSLKEQRVEMRKEAAGILDEFVKIIDKKFADWDRISQQREEDFMKQLKDRAYEIIRDDCKHKGVMVRLLREDVQAVLDHLNTKK